VILQAFKRNKQIFGTQVVNIRV